MNDVPDTELFSAYLDGELTADEQVRVEQILATSPVARQLLEELRALSTTLQGLPQEKLGEDLSARILEVAERRMLLPEEDGTKPSAGRAANALNPPDADSIGWLGIPWREISWREMLSKRALIWSVVIVATAIIVSFTSPPPPNRTIAKRDRQPVAGEAVDSAGQPGPRSTSAGSWDAPAGESRMLQTDGKLTKKTVLLAAGAKDEERLAGADVSLRNTKDGHEGEHLKPGATTRVGATFRAKSEGEIAAGGETARETLSKAAKAVSAHGDSRQVADALAKDKAALLEQKTADIAVRSELKMAMPPAGAPAESKAATAAVPATPRAPSIALDRPEPSKPELAKSAEGLSPPEPKGAAPSKALGTEPMAKRADAKAVSKDDDTVEKSAVNGAEQRQFMYGARSKATNDKSSVGGVADKSAKGGQAGSESFAILTAATTVVRLDVSSQAMRDKVFDRLLSQQSLSVDPNATNVALYALARNPGPRGGQPMQGSAGGNAYSEGTTVNSGTVSGAIQLAPSGSAASGNMTQQQTVSLPESPAGQRTGSRIFKSEGASQSAIAPTDSQRRLASEDQADRIDNAKAPQGQLLEKSPREVAGSMRKQGGQPGPSTMAQNLSQNQVARGYIPGSYGSDSKPMIYAFYAGPEQIKTILKQLGERTDSFSVRTIDYPNSYPQHLNDDVSGFGGGMGAVASGRGGMGVGGMGGGGLRGNAAGQQPAAKPENAVKSAPAPTSRPLAPVSAPQVAQQAAVPASPGNVQLVVFVLSVVDRLPPVAGRASQLPPPAAAVPAKP